MNITGNENFNNFTLPIEQVYQIEDNKAKKLERCNSFDNFQNNTLKSFDECALIFNIIILICGCKLYPVFFVCSSCYFANPNPLVRIIAKVNITLFIIYACLYTFIYCSQ